MDKEEEVPELEIVNTKPFSPSLSDDQTDSKTSLTDRGLHEELERNKVLLVSVGSNLPDKGEKIRLRIAVLEEEKKRRASNPSKMNEERSSELMHSTCSGSDAFARRNTASEDTSIQGDTGSKEVSRSTFAACFSKPKTDSQPTKAFSKELEDLGCTSGKQKADKKTVTRQKGVWRMLSNVGKTEHSENQYNFGFKGSTGNQRSMEPYSKKNPKESSTYALLDDDDDTVGHANPSSGTQENELFCNRSTSFSHREFTWKEYPSRSSKRHKKSDDTVINVDEEEPQPSLEAEQDVELPEGLPDDICYPSSDDPHFVQVSRKDLECLAPREFLTSPIMNFYIRFLQQQVSSTNQISANCHFFNTYFYKKLSDAVTYKGSDKDAFFVKFRRWWKGIDLFRKAYIFIPIHEDLHWSLVIVCIPDKKDESGLIILHLDSLGLHSRTSIVKNVKSFLKDEWHYLNQEDYSSDLPISEKVWRNLPRRITEADIQVPQQKNDFDCGPFVLFFIERFIEEAPQRLKRKDLAMFDKKWFRPDEASALRIKIRETLIILFRVSNQTDCQNDQNRRNVYRTKISDDHQAAS